MRDDDQADLRTALLAGAGLGLGLLGIFAVPVMAVVGLPVSFLAWRTARGDYRAGTGFALAGMVVGFLGVAALVARMITHL